MHHPRKERNRTTPFLSNIRTAEACSKVEAHGLGFVTVRAWVACLLVFGPPQAVKQFSGFEQSKTRQGSTRKGYHSMGCRNSALVPQRTGLGDTFESLHVLNLPSWPMQVVGLRGGSGQPPAHHPNPDSGSTAGGPE